jgi:beta-glucosidase
LHLAYQTYTIDAVKSAAAMQTIVAALMANNTFGIPVIVVQDNVNGPTLFNTTLFPPSLSVSQSWNIDLFAQAITVQSIENKALGVSWVLSPELDVAMEPRYGRVGETYGEDRYLNSQHGIAFVNAMQATTDTGTPRVAATLKHWVYGNSLGGINVARLSAGINDFYNVHGWPHLEVLAAAAPMALMPSYASYDRVPMTVNMQYTKNLLRDTIGFEGVVISDYGAIPQVYTQQHAAKSIQDAGVRALLVGVDHEISNPAQSGMASLETLGSNPQIAAAVTEAARRVLTMKFNLGLFEQPFPDTSNTSSSLRTPAHEAINLAISQESIVMLKNDGILPLSSELLSKVAVIGPMADVINPGSYAASDYRTGITILDGIESISSDVTYSMGCFRNNDTNYEALKADAIANAKSANVVIMVLGSAAESIDPSNPNDRTDGEGWTHADLNFPGPQVDLLTSIVATGTPVIVVISGGQAFAMEEAAAGAHGILHTFLQGEVSGTAVAEILTGKTNPSGKLTVSIPKYTGANPIYYNYAPSDRPNSFDLPTDYQYPVLNRTSRYPFGYGLSYTNFGVSDISVTNNTSTDGSIAIQATVTNTGAVAGKEVLQVYFSQEAPVIERPIKSLIRFVKVSLDPGKSEPVSFTVPASELGYYVSGTYQVDADDYTFYVGTSSEDVTAITVAVQ